MELLPDVHVDPGDHGAADLLVAAPDGPHAVGPPTVDSDADGRADTAVVAGPVSLDLVTDTDGDGRADVLTELHEDGSATTTELPAPSWDEGPVPPAPTIDPVTGRWVRGG
jgi:hypothetical protein